MSAYVSPSSARRLSVRPDVPVSGCGQDGRRYMRDDSERVQSGAREKDTEAERGAGEEAAAGRGALSRRQFD